MLTLPIALEADMEKLLQPRTRKKSDTGKRDVVELSDGAKLAIEKGYSTTTVR
jgi:hypothetical protein